MKSLGKLLTLAAVVAGCSFAATPALACGSCGTGIISQPAVLEQPAVMAPVVNQTLLQPAVVEPTYAAPACGVCSSGYGYGYGYRPWGWGFRHHHLFSLGTPLGGFSIF